MKPGIARVEQPVEAFRELFMAARSSGVRVGWIDFNESPEMPATLGLAAVSGAFRAVAVAERDVLSCKHLTGPPVFEDLVREYFIGCRLLLVRGAVEAPELAAVETGWRFRSASGREQIFSTDELLMQLREPRFP